MRAVLAQESERVKFPEFCFVAQSNIFERKNACRMRQKNFNWDCPLARKEKRLVHHTLSPYLTFCYYSCALHLAAPEYLKIQPKEPYNNIQPLIELKGTTKHGQVHISQQTNVNFPVQGDHCTFPFHTCHFMDSKELMSSLWSQAFFIME